MSEHEEIGELDAGIAAMLRREGARVDEVPAEVAARIAASIGGSGSGGGGGGGSGSGSGSGLGGGVAKLVGMFLVGAVVGGGVVGVVTPEPAAKVVYVERPVQSAANSSTAAAPVSNAITTMSVDALPAAPAATARGIAIVSASASASPSASASASASARAKADDAGEDSMVAERRVLDRARVALGQRDFATADEMLDAHAAAYPSGRLVEEREALRVRTLAASGRAAEARAAAAAFETRWPTSVLLPAVESAARP